MKGRGKEGREKKYDGAANNCHLLQMNGSFASVTENPFQFHMLRHCFYINSYHFDIPPGTHNSFFFSTTNNVPGEMSTHKCTMSRVKGHQG